MIQGFTSGGDAQLRFHKDDWDGLRAAVAAACARANTVKEEVDESSDDGFGGKFRNGDDLQSLVRALRNSEVDPMTTDWLILKVAVAKVGKILSLACTGW